MGWSKGQSIAMREKQKGLMIIDISDPWPSAIFIDSKMVEEIRNIMPELPAQKEKDLYLNMGFLDMMLGFDIFTGTGWSFEASVKLYDKEKVAKGAKTVSNWLMGDLMKLTKELGLELGDPKAYPSPFSSITKAKRPWSYKRLYCKGSLWWNVSNRESTRGNCRMKRT